MLRPSEEFQIVRSLFAISDISLEKVPRNFIKKFLSSSLRSLRVSALVLPLKCGLALWRRWYLVFLFRFLQI